MYSSLIDAPVNKELILLKITRPNLASWLQRLGLFVGSSMTRHDREINYHPVRIHGLQGDIIVPAGLGIKVFVHLDNDERKPLVEMKRKEKGHVETMSCGMGCINALGKMGIVEGSEVSFIRALPHMDYITLLDGKERTRLSESEAARIWGQCEEEDEQQFYFARQGKPFTVLDIIGGKKARQHLLTHGVSMGEILTLEAIEQAQGAHKPGVEPITISSPGGLRLYLTPAQAENVIVKGAEPDDEKKGSSGNGA